MIQIKPWLSSRARALLKRSSGFPMLARTLARVECLMKNYEEMTFPLDYEEAVEEDDTENHEHDGLDDVNDDEQTALNEAYSMYVDERRTRYRIYPDMTRLEHALTCFQAKKHIAINVTVEWSQQEYSINVIIIRESAYTLQFSTFIGSSSEAAGDVFRAFIVFDQLPDSPVGADDPIASIIWNAGYAQDERLEILESNSIAYVPEDVRRDPGYDTGEDGDSRWHSSDSD